MAKRDKTQTEYSEQQASLLITRNGIVDKLSLITRGVMQTSKEAEYTDTCACSNYSKLVHTTEVCRLNPNEADNRKNAQFILSANDHT